MSIGQKIKQRRVELGWSQRDLAAKMGYNNNSTIARIEGGQVDIPQSRIMQFSKVLGVSVAFLMGWEEAQKNDDIISGAVTRMRTDKNYLSAVKAISELDDEKLSSLLALLK